MNTIMNKEILGGKNKESTTLPRNASFSGNIHNNKHPMRGGPYSSFPLAHTPQSVPGLFAKTFPLHLSACPPACLLNPLACVPRVPSRTTASTVTYPPAPLPEEVRGVRMWLTGRPPPPS